jgi:dihydrofolate reductase
VITLVYAQSRNGVIGDAGSLPWSIPSDLKNFKAVTMGKPIIMGRKTWESLPRKPLPGRKNIVITRQSGFAAEGAVVAGTANEAIAAAGNTDDICIIGGGEIYLMFLPHATHIHLTEVDIDVTGDTLAPKLDFSQWKVVFRDGPFRGEKDSAAYSVRLLERIQ